MEAPLPRTFSEVVEEITKFTGLPKSEVEERVWLEAVQPGWNVADDVKNFGVVPHWYDDRMEKLYKEGDGFIFETMRFWAQPQRQKWVALAADRLRAYCGRHGMAPSLAKVLMLGDGAGNDSIYLCNQGFRIDYFDVPGSRTWEFALRRFRYYSLLEAAIRPATDYSACLGSEYDAVICFEVLEHLPQPVSAISDMSRMLKPHGVALVTESFGAVTPELPTHLSSNLGLAGRAPFLFLKDNMFVNWHSDDPLLKPMEYVKVDRRSVELWWRLVTDRRIGGEWASGQAHRFVRAARRLLAQKTGAESARAEDI